MLLTCVRSIGVVAALAAPKRCERTAEWEPSPPMRRVPVAMEPLEKEAVTVGVLGFESMEISLWPYCVTPSLAKKIESNDICLSTHSP